MEKQATVEERHKTHVPDRKRKIILYQDVYVNKIVHLFDPGPSCLSLHQSMRESDFRAIHSAIASSLDDCEEGLEIRILRDRIQFILDQQ